MSLFQFRWLRKFMRKNTNQIPEESARIWKQRLSIAYMLIAWNAGGLVLYNIFKGNLDWAKQYKTEADLALTPAQQFSRTLGIKDATVYKVTGLNISKYEIHNNFDEDVDINKGNETIQE